MVTFKLEEESHLLTGIASAHMGGFAATLAFGRGGMEALNGDCGFWFGLLAVTPGMKFLIGYPGLPLFALQ